MFSRKCELCKNEELCRKLTEQAFLLIKPMLAYAACVHTPLGEVCFSECMHTQMTNAHDTEFQAVPSSAYAQRRVYAPPGVSVCFSECMRAQKLMHMILNSTCYPFNSSG